MCYPSFCFPFEGHNSPRVASSHQYPETTPLSRSAWSDTPAATSQHQVSPVPDSPEPNGDSPNRVIEVIEISDSNERMNNENGDATMSSDTIVDKGTQGGSMSDKTHPFTKQESLSKALKNDRTERDGVLASKQETIVETEHVYRHIHKHKHKHSHRHEHRYKHEHRHKHEHRYKRKYKDDSADKQHMFHNRNNARREKYRQKRHVTISKAKSISEDDFSAGGQPSSSARPSVDTDAHVEHSNYELQTDKVRQGNSPNVEDMRSEVEELNALIQQHEDQLSRLTKRTES